MSYISERLKRLVIERADERCEYCRQPQSLSLFSFEMEHIIAKKHDGSTTAENLALACPHCNGFKGSDLGSIDPETGVLTPFYHPRLQHWLEHFRFEQGEIIPVTAEGRVTVKVLRFNLPERIEERSLWVPYEQEA